MSAGKRTQIARHPVLIAVDNYRALKGGRPALQARQRERLAAMVDFARANSPFYREHHRELPASGFALEDLPPTTKPMLMNRFDDWVTDPEVTYADVEAFLEDKTNVGVRFLDRYLVNITSGSSGHRGVFLLDRNVATVQAAIGLRKYVSWLSLRELITLVIKGMRLAAVVATGDHFASYAGLTEARRTERFLRDVRIYSVHSANADLVASLNAYQPLMLVGYARTIAQLAEQQRAGRLRIAPTLVAVTGERLDPAEYEDISAAFGTRVRDYFGCTEASELSYDCDHGWHHLHADWFALEPVDAEFRTVVPGEPSHTVLLTNLINRTQPILRYDLGDSIVMRPDPCSCGNPLPAFLATGRSSDVLRLSTSDGTTATIAPMTLTTALEPVLGASRYQIVQTAPDALAVRFTVAEGADADTTWRAMAEALREVLANAELAQVWVQRDPEPPAQTAGGKYRAVIPLSG